MIAEGQRAPDVTAMDQHGQRRTLSELWAKGPVVLYFYPKDETLGCTAEACAFRDRYQTFTDAGAEVVGVSRDGVASHAAFASHHRLPFVLLADTDGAIEKAYGVQATFGFIKGRVTFVIDRQGIVRLVFDSKLRPTAHIGEALDVVMRLAPAT
ncbi:MAG: peroxiredoxin [Deltaproteobacteria bacterium]|nr:peroxiredoxin [Deltaproteobacteria bacterium]